MYNLSKTKLLKTYVQFKVGTGFSDAQRKNPPKKGAVISFKFQEVSNSGVPRFPVFLRVREDVTWKEVKENALKSAPKSEEKKKSFVLKKAHTVLYTTVPSRDQVREKRKLGLFFFQISLFFVFQETNAKQITDDDVNDPPALEPGGSKREYFVCGFF